MRKPVMAMWLKWHLPLPEKAYVIRPWRLVGWLWMPLWLWAVGRVDRWHSLRENGK